MAEDTETKIPTVEELRKRINENTAGTYGEGRIGTAVKEFQSLQNLVRSGDLSQQDYVKIGAQLIPEIQGIIGSIAGSGSSGANAARAAGGDKFNQDIARDFNIYKSAQELLGRDITETELAEFKPRFGGEGGVETGRAYLAEIAKQEAKSPGALAKKAGEFTGQVNQTFQGLLGRDATASEADYYGRLLASGDVSPYEIEQYVKAGQEYQGQQDKAFRGELAGELGEYTQEAFEKATPKILAQYRRAGSGVGTSSDIDFAIAKSLEELEGQREQYLSGLSASQYGGNKAAARADYETLLNQYLSGKAYDRQRSDQYSDVLTNRAFESQDYERMMRDYMRMLESQPRQRGSNPLMGAITGAGALAPLGPWVAAAGGAAGLYASLLS